ncbi:MAG: substrate-binding domain-containing protein [Thermoplasmata archaeon]|nr:substrate-binding domain-containing protein [Thermoplasmata archaeon]
MTEGDDDIDGSTLDEGKVPTIETSRPRAVASVRVSVWIGVIIVIMLLVIAGWYVDTHVFVDEDDGEPPYYSNMAGYPRVDGSTSTHPLGMIACCYQLNTRWEWKEHWDESHRVYPLYLEPMYDEILEWVDHSGTHGSYVNLIKKKTDLILVAREPSDSELELAEDRKVGFEIVPIAYDAFVFIVNVNCSVHSLTTDQIQRIYTGEIINWLDVGGVADTINPYQRDENSGSQELMMDLVMKDLEMIDAPNMILQGMMGPIIVISGDTLGLGYSVYYYEQFMAPNEQLQLVTVDGVTPSYETIASGEYPYTTEVYAVIRTDMPGNHPAKWIWDWLQSKEGQTVVKSSGYVPVMAI